MSITDKEKEEIFIEFKMRLMKEAQGYASGYETLHNMESAKDYFWEKYYAMTNEFNRNDWLEKGIVSTDWDMIRKLVCHAYGVSIVKSIPSENLTDANNLAKRIIDLIFETNHEVLKGES